MNNNEELSDEKLNSVTGGGFFDTCDNYDGPGTGLAKNCLTCSHAIKNFLGLFVGCNFKGDKE